MHQIIYKKNLLSTFKHYNVAMIRRFSLTSIVKIVIHTHTQTDTHTHTYACKDNLISW